MNPHRRRRVPGTSIESLESRISPATLNLVGGAATFTAGNGVSNSVTLSVVGANYTITTSGETITLNAAALGAGFLGNGTATITASAAAISSLVFALGDLNDSLTINNLQDPITVTDGDGADTITVALAVNPGGAVDLSAETINVASSISGATSVILTGNLVNIGANIAASQQVTVQPLTAGREMSLGAETAGMTSLTDAEFDRVTAPLFNVGSSAAGNISILGGVTPSGASTLVFRSGGKMADTNAGFLVGNNVGIDVAGGISLTNLSTDILALEAETDTGGIRVSQNAPLTIGGVNSTLRGLFVVNSGDIDIVSFGTLTLNDDTGGETIHGGTTGDVRLSAVGVTSNIIATINRDSIFARGSIYLNAGQDVLFGTVGSDFDNDVRAGHDIQIHAGRDFVVDGFSDFAADDSGLGSGNLLISAGRNINLSNATGVDASVGVSGNGGGKVTLETAAGGQVILNAPTSNAVFGRSGGILLHTDRLVIAATSGISATQGGAITIEPATPGRQITLGSVTDAAPAVEISATEFGRLGASLIRIGNTTNAGSISFTNAITTTATLALLTPLSIVDNVAGESAFITAPNLRLQAGTGMGDGNDLDLSVNSLAFSGTGNFVLENSGELTIGTVDGVSTSSATGNLVLAASGSINVAAPIVAGGGTLTLAAAGISQAAPITQLGAGNVQFIANASSIILNHPGNDFIGTVTTTSFNEVKITDKNDLVLGSQTFNGLFEIGAVGNATQTGIFFGVGNLRFAGPGTMLLDLANSYSGNTEVTGGRLQVAGLVNSPTIIARDGGTLAGGASFGSSVEIRSNGRFEPGIGVGTTVAANGIQFFPGSSIKVELNGTTAGVTHDQLSVLGAVNLNGAGLSGSLGFVPAVGDEFVIIANDGADPVVGTFLGVPQDGTVLLDGTLFRVSYKGGDGNDVVVTAGEITGKSLSFADADGDLVTIKTTAGSLSAANLVMLETPTGPQIAKLILGPDFKGANVTISAKATKSGGNGLVNVGYIDATGVDLGIVTVKGDLGQIDAGDNDPAAPALKGLVVQSLGNLGLSTQGPGGSLESNLAGSVVNLTVKGDLRDASFQLVGAESKLLNASVGGTLIGAALHASGGMGNLRILGSVIDGTILADTGALGAITINGEITGDSLIQATIGGIKAITVGGHLGAGIEIHAGTTLGPVNVKNEIAGTAGNPVIISAFGQAVAPAKGIDTAIKSLTVRGRVEGLQLLAGYNPAGVGTNADASIGAIKVGGDWVASTVLAGVSAGADGFAGTADDTKIALPLRDSAALFAQIGSIVVRGQALGSIASGDAFGVVTEQIIKAQFAGVSLPLVKGPGNAADAFALGPTGPGATGLTSDFFAREVI